MSDLVHAAISENAERRIVWAIAVIGLAASLMLLAGCSGGGVDSDGIAAAHDRAGSAEREWRTYLGDLSSSQTSPLAEINRSNVASLRVAWTYHSGAPEGVGLQMQVNPLVIDGVLYGSSPNLTLFALDASTGKELWRFDPGTGSWAASASRGLAYWNGGSERRLFFGARSFLYAIEADTGRVATDFGEDGRIDLREGLGRDLAADVMGVTVTTPATIFENLILIGGRVNEMEGAAPGHVRAFDAQTGALVWTFRTIPSPGEDGYETWPTDAWQTAGGANAWAGITVDAERGLAFVPTGSATPDFYGADRLGDNLYANSLVALDARTGERVWHRQLVRHDLWDRDLPSPPNLIELERDGEFVPAVAQVTKTGDTFVFHRETGESLFPLREEPVAPSEIDGEVAAPSQPIPVLPRPFVRQTFDESLVSDRSPEIAAAIRGRVKEMKHGALYIPPSVEGTVMVPGTDGGAEWGRGGLGCIYPDAFRERESGRLDSASCRDRRRGGVARHGLFGTLCELPWLGSQRRRRDDPISVRRERPNGVL